MSNHEKAVLTYEALQKRKAKKNKEKDKIIDDVRRNLVEHCMKLHYNHVRHTGKGAIKTKCGGCI